MELTYDWEQLLVAVPWFIFAARSALQALIASLLSYFYLFLISLCAQLLVWLCLIFLVTLPTALGLLYVYMSASPEIVVPHTVPGMITMGDTQNDLYFGLCLCGVGIALACVAVVQARTIKLALTSIEEPLKPPIEAKESGSI